MKNKNKTIEEMFDFMASNVKDLTRPEIRKAAQKAVTKTLMEQELQTKRDNFRKDNYKGQVR